MLKARDEAKIAERFGKLLVRLREERGLGLREAARQIGIHHARLSSLEKGADRQTGSRTKPTLHQFADIARVYRYDKERLLAEAGYLPWMLDAAQIDHLLAYMKAPAPNATPIAAEVPLPEKTYGPRASTD